MSFESTPHWQGGDSEKPRLSAGKLFMSALSYSGLQGFGSTPKEMEYLASLQQQHSSKASTAPVSRRQSPTFHDTEDIRWLKDMADSGDAVIELIDSSHQWHSQAHCKADSKE